MLLEMFSLSYSVLSVPAVLKPWKLEPGNAQETKFPETGIRLDIPHVRKYKRAYLIAVSRNWAPFCLDLYF
jgi:hypothetical protein